MTSEELARHDGREGRSTYVAYKGKVYDVSESPLWQGGEHEGMHKAGADLTPMMEGAPHGAEVFARFAVVGTLEDGVAEVTEPERASPSSQTAPPTEAFERRRRLREWYRKYHPHPMVVHFPIALHLFAAGMDLLFFAMPQAVYASAVFYTFFAATVMGAVAMVPGIISWQINYAFSMRRPFVVKMIVSVAMLLLGIVAIGIYLEEARAVYTLSAAGILYHAIVLLTGAGVIVLGYYGGKITWGEAQIHTAPTGETPAATVAASEPKTTVDAASPETEASLTRAKNYDIPHPALSGTLPVTLSSPPSRRGAQTVTRSVAILIGGAAGLGIDTLEKVLSDAFIRSGFYVYTSKEFMSRVRGGSNTVLIRIADAPVEAPCWDVDLFVALDAPALEHVEPRLGADTLVVADVAFTGNNPGWLGVPLQEKAKALGNLRYANTMAAGIIYGMLGLSAGALHLSVTARFGDDESNSAAVDAGIEVAGTLESPPLPPLPATDPEGAKALHLMDGTTACGFGFLAGGCNFVASYPMSPSTGVLNFMAAQSKHFDIAVEQSEDEIASIHMVMGAWYAGARALTTTSGGGFALMGEGISLAGITETPAVVYLAQRPGPATGLPTRSEQGDLNLALHSGHGPFPRIILAPGSLRECVDLGYLAFELADRKQLPVIVLSDQYLADSMAMTGSVDFAAYETRRYVVSPEKAYRRYTVTQSGITPRALPAAGRGLVCSDGHEHDERGQITEDFRVRERMVIKRERKAVGVAAEALAPEVIGEGSIAVIGWGSTRGAIAEALARLGDSRTVQVHFCWVHPLNPEQLRFLDDFTTRIVVENSADAAFAERLTLCGVRVDRTILQSNGFAFFADQLASLLDSELKELA